MSNLPPSAPLNTRAAEPEQWRVQGEEWRAFARKPGNLAEVEDGRWLTLGCPKCDGKRWEVTADCWAYCSACRAPFGTTRPLTPAGQIVATLDYSEPATPQDGGAGELVDSSFEYLLNAMEGAAQHATPAEHGYGEKRRIVLRYVSDLRAKVAQLTRERDDALEAAQLAERNASASIAHIAEELALSERAGEELQQDNDRLRAELDESRRAVRAIQQHREQILGGMRRESAPLPQGKETTG